MKRRVVVTGLGVISPVGLNLEDFWKSLTEGKSGVKNITYFDTTNFNTKFAAQLTGYDPLNYMDRKLSQRCDPFTQYAISATQMAINHSGLNLERVDKNSVGVVYGSGIGGMWTYDKQQRNLFEREGSPDRISPFFIPMLIADIAAGRISMQYGFKGPNYATISACTTSAHSIIDSVMIIQRGNADVMVTGGSEAVICPMGVGGFNAMKALSTRNDAPEKASRPFDKNRDGFVMGEGAATLILEELEHAKSRGATIYAEISGIGMSADAHHITEPAPNGEGVANAIKIAINDAGLKPEDIDAINAHGTSTPPNDKNETAAIKSVFGERAYNLNVHSIKSMIGHLLGAAGAIEAISSILSIRDNIIPPTINFEEPDPDCDLNYVFNTARKTEVKTIISDNSGFGGHNTAIIFQQYED
ncbi:MAG: beta-ketoacyl-ACP synthase II [Ignavibacteriaceae bacterium]|jgi:3-oxoacyl-[acyl-carrier-protein] synthase II|nr:MAG: beta-ketoacyl-[acyl-carrier-protein] synthase II [Chlorobiota bacterium]KXK02604.1 MAG: 3-oxoacyl-ACP synthase [Chlorobi bacterium OLB4]MBV6398775.1 3-oxoacyl-[acyl-carrier-protein] synthase 2 [Ignavibacteria bacterium]MCC6885053.1 beta-ketoacyl-ACP synthase II [Ignavibacteriales bacterium]MCE7952156.1 beta-ketoacyl-[acyl-carrier-protein] synthase II [Chlorobi bacterium CHB7]MDL1886287.1 beta-ketoacyl-ACP synthase II [Ignavibacteria bacterium CHB1]MEB2329442.1 beta-ketoacyl-ACP syntha